jgi:hypothetical protein
LPGGEPLLHSADVASRPVKAAAFWDTPVTVNQPSGNVPDTRQQMPWRRLERPVVASAPCEWSVLPVDAEHAANSYCGFVDPFAGKRAELAH